jgi:exopolysaccharide biosynthesis polyprenyl glycosylphosphotransferase
MLKEHDHLLRQVMIALDLALITAAFFLSYFLRNEVAVYAFDIKRMYTLETYLSVIPLLWLVWGSTLYISGAYGALRYRNFPEVFIELTHASFLAMLVFASVAYLLKFQYISRFFIVLIFFMGWMLLVFSRIALMTFLHSLRKHGYNYRHVLMVGTGPRAQNFMSLIKKHPEWGLRIIGLVDEDPDLVGQEIMGHPVIGTLSQIPKIFEYTVVDEVVFVVPRSWLGRVENVVLYCEQVGKRVSIAVDLFTVKFAKAIQSGLEDFPLLMFQTTPDKIWQLSIKRVLDVLLSAFALILLSPLFLALILIIKKTSPSGSIFFKQKRCSVNGRIFTLFKFRTMIPNAEKMLETLRKQNEMSGPAFKMTNDPRTTPLGKWIRKFSLDELPQFLNVLKGDMSIVGPRPPIPLEVEKYEPWQRRRLSMRPGLTCLWQIKGRNKIVSFDEWMRLDLQYIDQWSLWLDLKIFLKTIPIVLFGIGAK